MCPVCGRTLGAFDRLAWHWAGWRRGACAGCEACLAPAAGEVLFYEVWEAPETWCLED